MSLTADCKKELLINRSITTNSAMNMNVIQMFAFHLFAASHTCINNSLLSEKEHRGSHK